MVGSVMMVLHQLIMQLLLRILLLEQLIAVELYQNVACLQPDPSTAAIPNPRLSLTQTSLTATILLHDVCTLPAYAIALIAVGCIVAGAIAAIVIWRVFVWKRAKTTAQLNSVFRGKAIEDSKSPYRAL